MRCRLAGLAKKLRTESNTTVVGKHGKKARWADIDTRRGVSGLLENNASATDGSDPLGALDPCAVPPSSHTESLTCTSHGLRSDALPFSPPVHDAQRSAVSVSGEDLLVEALNNTISILTSELNLWRLGAICCACFAAPPAQTASAVRRNDLHQSACIQHTST